jgi:hypothetical protein
MRNVENGQTQSLLQLKEEQLALAVHLANANAVPLSTQVIELLSKFVANTLGGHGDPFQEWVRLIESQRNQEQEEERISRHA